MKLTIIPSDGAVYKDGVSYNGLDLSSAPDNVHALQWDEAKGWIEFVNQSEFKKPANEHIEALPEWAIAALAEWDEAKAAAEAAAAEAAAAQEAITPQPADEPQA